MNLKIFTRLLTHNFQKIPLLWVNFNLKKFKKHGAKNSCTCIIHPVLAEDSHIKETLYELCDYIRENYNMEDVI